MSTVAVMQPYWCPYPGYFRLIAEADTFVFLDDVQFPRRGYVHRNRFRKQNGHVDWFTLPLKKAPRSVTINELEFHEDAGSLIGQQQHKFPLLRDGFGHLDACMANLDRPVVELLMESVIQLTAILGQQCDFRRASESEIRHTTAQERIIALAKWAGGTRYVNAPGGADLYDEVSFRSAALELVFLEPWEGGSNSVLQEGAERGWDELHRAISRQR